MKRDLLIMFLLASLLVMTGCSQENIPGGDDGVEDAQTSYLAINLRPADESPTRAANGYEDGDPLENKVNSVRFYFFGAAGGIANVNITSSGGYVNYYDWTPGSSDKDPDYKDDPDNVDPGNQDPDNPGNGDTNNQDDIESKLTATIVINTAKGDKVPNMVAAVINPAGLPDESLPLTELKKKVADYASAAYTGEGTFVMFNSIYAGGDGNGNGAVVINQSGDKKNLWTTAKDAKEHPVTIYVERSVAKVRVTLGNEVAAAGTSMLALKDKEGNDLKVGAEQVYLKLEGWGLTADTSEGRLVKKINPGWAGTWWNSTHRSFWAINSMTATNRYHDYKNSIGSAIGTITVGEGGSTTTTPGAALYTNENAVANDYDPVTTGQAPNHTKVILKGKLCDHEGKPFTIVRHLGTHFADDYSETEADNLKELKKSILNQLSAKGYNYYTPDVAGRKQLDVGDLKITIATKIESEDSKNNCYVYAQLTTEAEGKTWYTSLDGTTTADKDVINGNLKNKDIVDWALVWNGGMTYYYYEIKHLGDQIGVVRNHVYDTTVTKIAGLGTPVYDPTQIIYPEKPDPNDHFIAAQIMILSWRIVGSQNELKW